MHIKRAKQEIKDTIEAYLKKDEYGEYVIPVVNQRPILLMGPPGIGKTQIIEQVTKECGIALVAYTITHHTRQSAIGLPFITEKTYGGVKHSVTEYTMSEIIASVYDKMEETGLTEGVLFIDEINCVSETLAPAMLQFLQCKTFGNQAVPEGWLIVAAGNPPEYNKSVRDFDVVTLDRLKKIDVEENYEVWKEYAYQAGIHPAILSYLELKKDNFYRVETTVDGKAFATARGWEDLSHLLWAYDELGKTADRDVVYQYIQHPTIAKDFAVYLRLYDKYKKDYGLTQVLDGHYDADTVNKLHYAAFDERLSVVEMLIGELGGLMKDAWVADQFVSLLYESVKQYRDQEQKDFGAVVQAFEDQYEQFRKAERLTKTQDRIYRDALAKLDEWKPLTTREHLEPEETYQAVKTKFEEEVDLRQQKFDKAGAALDNAFSFLEEAFGESQEMVVFVTELNTNFYTIQYLKDHDCDAYTRYNQKLLISKQREDILNELDTVEQEMPTGIKEEM